VLDAHIRNFMPKGALPISSLRHSLAKDNNLMSDVMRAVMKQHERYVGT